MNLARRRTLPRLFAIPALAVAACAPTTSVSVGPGGDTSDYRLYQVSEGRFVTLEDLAADLAGADVLFFGEFHDDQTVHRVQQELFTRVGEARDRALVLGLEMFERDVQPVLDGYVSGEIEEEEFLEQARPWPNYRTDYRPLVEMARDRGGQVVGTNMPQALATGIARAGLTSLEGLSPGERATAAAEIECPADEYFERFMEAIGGAAESAHGAASDTDPMMQRVFEAQCARDETMAEAIAPLIRPDAFVFHVNGSFHTDHYLGIVPRLLRREPEARVRIVATVQVEDLANPAVEEHSDRADYVLFTREPLES
jgi:uncharacterized iron-regulated protein